MAALAYIRRSASEESPVSEDAQREIVAKLAAEKGRPIERVYRDWGRSGGAEDRPQYLAMLERVERGGVEAVYAYDQDRLARSNWLFAGLLRLADLHGFAIITPAGDLTADSRRDFAEIRGVMDGVELRKMKRRAKAIDAKQRKREDDRGVPPFGYVMKARKQRSPERVEFVKVDPEGIAHVIAAYRASGTFQGAARALNVEGFPSKRGGGWHAVTVAALIRREAPELVAGVTKGRRSRSPKPRYFRGLLRCHCGGSMSPGASKNRNPATSHLYYYCGRGQRGVHDAPLVIAESKLMAWIKAEAAHLRPPSEVEMDAEGSAYDDSAERRGLEAMRDAIGEDAYALAVANLDATRAAHGERARVIVAVPQSIDWDWTVENINTVLRSMWDYVELGPDLMPVEATWRVAEWRAS